MDQATLQKIARLRRLAGQQGKPFDVMRFASDTDYARATLSAVLDTDDEETLVVGMSLMEVMFPVAPPAPRSAPMSVPVEKPPSVELSIAASDKKYVGRLR